ncbi:hypothetical protein ACFQZT_15080 [Paenibacillus sp. GCM10027628]|uniref:hypothetical protein n=1 Tax=Paenibacillus sp. GCM10027628 TaxID=3273413 RepID=UPI003640A00B
MRKLGFIALCLLIFASISSSVAASGPGQSIYACGERQNDSQCYAKPSVDANWTTVPGNSCCAGAQWTAALNTKNDTTSSSWWGWTISIDVISPTIQLQASTYLSNKKFVDVVKYRYGGTSYTLDQEYAPNGWSFFPTTFWASAPNTLIVLERSTYYGGMGADDMWLDNKSWKS